MNIVGREKALRKAGQWESVADMTTTTPISVEQLALQVFQKFDMTPAIQDYRYEYWVNDAENPGYRKWKLDPGNVSQIDFSDFPGASNESSSVFTFNLDAVYNTGEIRSKNHLAGWATDSSYLYLNIVPINSNTDALVQIRFNDGPPYESNAVMHVTHESYSNTFTFINLPDFTD